VNSGDDLDLPAALAQDLARIGDEFTAAMLGRFCARHPRDAENLIELAALLTRLGRYQEGLSADQELVRLLPEDPTVHYNLACSLALTGAPDQAVAALEIAVRLGYRDREHLLGDEDLASLRSNPRFRALLERLPAE
jgi:Flp pilus assembly protein TadD